MLVPNWWSSHGDGQIATGEICIDNYRCAWECNLRNMHSSETGQAEYFVVAFTIKRILDAVLVFAKDIRFDAPRLLEKAGDISQFSGMEFEIRLYMEKYAENAVKRIAVQA